MSSHSLPSTVHPLAGHGPSGVSQTMTDVSLNVWDARAQSGAHSRNPSGSTPVQSSATNLPAPIPSPFAVRHTHTRSAVKTRTCMCHDRKGDVCVCLQAYFFFYSNPHASNFTLISSLFSLAITGHGILSPPFLQHRQQAPHPSSPTPHSTQRCLSCHNKQHSSCHNPQHSSCRY